MVLMPRSRASSSMASSRRARCGQRWSVTRNTVDTVWSRYALRWTAGYWATSPADSDLEVLMGDILATFGLPAAEFHAHIGGYEVDFWIVGSNVVIECDGWSSHGLDRDQFEFDRVRDADLLAQGFITVRATWQQMVRGPRAVARRIETTLAQWSPEVLRTRAPNDPHR
jgi:hypothetical protein